MKVFKVNVFTKKPNEGNPAAVVIDFSGLEKDMQSIAFTLNMPVTVFILPSKTANCDVLLRFFSSANELEMCGHGTIAAACYLFNQTSLAKIIAETIHQQTLELIKNSDGSSQFTINKLKNVNFSIDKKEVGNLLGISSALIADQTLPFCVGSIGSPKLLVPVASKKVLRELNPDFSSIKYWSIKNKINGIYVYTNDTVDEPSSFHARSFNPKSGIDEDIATGVAAAALATVLPDNNKTYIIEQGDILGKPSRIVISIEKDTVYVGGFAVLDPLSMNTISLQPSLEEHEPTTFLQAKL